MQKNEFYLEPPYDYRPSVAQYLIDGKVSLRGVVADIMHLDRKKNLKILHYHPDGKGMDIKLISENDLNDNEFYLYRRLEVNSTDRDVKLRFSDLADKEGIFLEHYTGMVQRNVEHKLKITQKPAYDKALDIVFGRDDREAVLLFACVILTAVAISEITKYAASGGAQAASAYVIFGAFIALRIFFEVVRTIVDAIWENTIKEYVRLALYPIQDRIKGAIIGSILMLLLVGGHMLLSPLTSAKNEIGIIASFLMIPVGGYFLWSVYLLVVSPLGVFLNSADVNRHISAWKRFSNKIHSFSQLKKKPLKYYELWGEFYYYALAVGAIDFGRGWEHV